MKIVWTEHTALYFGNHLPTGLDTELTDQYCIECSENASFPWTEQTVDFFKQRLNWDFMAQNERFVGNEVLVHRYREYLQENKETILETQERIRKRKLKGPNSQEFRFPAIAGNNLPPAQLTLSYVKEISKSQPLLISLNRERVWNEVFAEFQNDIAICTLLEQIVNQ